MTSSIKRKLLKFGDLISDPRNPIRIPYYLARGGREPEADLSPDLEVKFSLTVDVEHDFGITSTLGELSTLETGINDLLELFEEESIEGTFFVSHPVLENFPELVVEISNSHEVGVHGYNHECWGDPKWWLKDDRILDEKRKRELLKEMSESIEEVISKRPKSFRAPYITANRETLKVLDELSFEVDSSAPSYYGTFPKPRTLNGLSLKEIPISANPKPKIVTSPYPHPKFNWMNTKLLNIFGLEKFLEFSRKILGYQIEKGVEPHLVMLLHQWEFADLKETATENSKYATEDNSKILIDFLDRLKDEFDVTFLKINELSERIN